LRNRRKVDDDITAELIANRTVQTGVCNQGVDPAADQLIIQCPEIVALSTVSMNSDIGSFRAIRSLRIVFTRCFTHGQKNGWLGKLLRLISLIISHSCSNCRSYDA
jgi:hypothetical protein